MPYEPIKLYKITCPHRELFFNFNQIGCSQNCKVDTGYTCRNTSPSVCSQNNPVCGNGIIEVAEGCDDRNLINGDGCNTFCNI